MKKASRNGFHITRKMKKQLHKKQAEWAKFQGTTTSNIIVPLYSENDY